MHKPPIRLFSKFASTSEVQGAYGAQYQWPGGRGIDYPKDNPERANSWAAVSQKFEHIDIGDASSTGGTQQFAAEVEVRKKSIKICGITDPTLAFEAAQAGADLIGLVFHPSSKRLVTLEQAKAITTALRSTKAKPVAVFTEHSAAEMHQICDDCTIKIAQLHGHRSRSEHHLLSKDYQRIYVQSVSLEGTIQKNKDNGLALCAPSRDYLLFDYSDPGNGISFDWENFSHSLKKINLSNFRWFLAGGLHPDNVQQAGQALQPYGVDVSSGVEDEFGKKQLSLIQQFIKNSHD